MSFKFSSMLTALQQALRFTPVTLLLAFVPLLIGGFLGTLIALVRVYNVRVLGRFFQGFVVIVKGIPVVLLLLMTYFIFVQGFDLLAEQYNWSVHSKDINTIYIAMLPLTVFATVNLSEAMRGALLSVERGQYEAGYSIGLTKSQTLRHIIIPQALPVAVPMLCSSFIGLVKGSSLAFMLSVTDLLNGALITATSNYNFLEAYIAAALVYWVICILIERLSYHLERRLMLYKRRVEV